MDMKKIMTLVVMTIMVVSANALSFTVVCSNNTTTPAPRAVQVVKVKSEPAHVKHHHKHHIKHNCHAKHHMKHHAKHHAHKHAEAATWRDAARHHRR